MCRMPFALMFGLAGTAVQAGTITVNSLTDQSNGSCATTCTLRDAVAAAQPGDTIRFSETLPWPATLTLSGSELLLYKNLDIIGPGRDNLTLDGNHASRLFEIAGPITVSISGLTLVNGTHKGEDGAFGRYDGMPGYGGAILVQPNATLQLTRVDFGGNQAIGGEATNIIDLCSSERGNGGNAAGGAIYSEGTLIIHHANFVNNSVKAGSASDEMPIPCFEVGDGGNAAGGALWASGYTEIVSAEFLLNVASGGTGGQSFLNDQVGGSGGNAEGGALALTAYASATFVTAKQNSLHPGLGDINGAPIRSGHAAGLDIHSSNTLLLRNVAFDSDGTWSTCSLSSPVFQGLNYAVSTAAGCHGFQLYGGGPFGMDPAYLELRGSGTRTYAIPMKGSSLLDRVTDCTDTFNQPVEEDVRGKARPMDSNDSGTAECEIGAVEEAQPVADEIFADGFD